MRACMCACTCIVCRRLGGGECPWKWGQLPQSLQLFCKWSIAFNPFYLSLPQNLLQTVLFKSKRCAGSASTCRYLTLCRYGATPPSKFSSLSAPARAASSPCPATTSLITTCSGKHGNRGTLLSLSTLPTHLKKKREKRKTEWHGIAVGKTRSPCCSEACTVLVWNLLETSSFF